MPTDRFDSKDHYYCPPRPIPAIRLPGLPGGVHSPRPIAIAGPRLNAYYRPLPAVRQPHWQLVDSQRHPPLGHPQEQFAHSHVVVAAVSLGLFFRFVIVFSSFLQRFMRFQRG
jgi:hypothetical protein